MSLQICMASKKSLTISYNLRNSHDTDFCSDTTNVQHQLLLPLLTTQNVTVSYFQKLKGFFG